MYTDYFDYPTAVQWVAGLAKGNNMWTAQNPLSHISGRAMSILILFDSPD